MNFWETKTWNCHMYLKIWNVHGFTGNDKNRKYLKFEEHRIRFFGDTEAHAIYGCKILRINQDCGWHTKIAGLLFKIPHRMLSFFSPSLIHYNDKSSIRKKIKALCHFWGRNNNKRNKILSAKRLRGERGSGRMDSGVNGKEGETTRGRNDSRRKGKWAKRLRGEWESGRNDPDSCLVACHFFCTKSGGLTRECCRFPL